MKKALAMLCVAACFSTPMLPQETKPAATPDLVTTAKEAKAKRKKSSTKVITNKDVRKSKGKLIVLDKTDDPPKTAAKDTTSPLQKQDVTFRQRRDAVDRVAVAQKRVDSLQKELDTLEQNYYAENDPNYRDRVIQERFGQTKRQLDDAQRELADARDMLQKLTSPQK